MGYKLEGRLLEVCNCRVLCPCWIGEDPDFKTCDTIIAWHFDVGGNAGLLIFNLVIGSLVAAIGYTPFFIGLAALDLLGAALLWTIVREPRPSEHAQAHIAAPA